MRTSDTLTDFVPALIAARKLFQPIRRENTAQIGANRSYQYAGLDTVLDAVLLPLLTNGLVVLQTVEPDTSTLLTRLVHTSGQWVESAYPLELNQPPQQLGSAITYGRRYCLLAILGVATEDDDGAAAAPVQAKPLAVRKPTVIKPGAAPRGTISEAQKRRLWAIASEFGWRHEDVKSWLVATYAVASSANIAVEQYDEIVKHLEAGPPPDPPVAPDFAF